MLRVAAAVPGNGVDNSDILKALSRAVAQTVGKPEQWVMVSLTTDKPMCYSGTEAPCAYGELVSIGAIGGEKNKTVSDFLQFLQRVPICCLTSCHVPDGTKQCLVPS